jgi:hypothetical protein
MAVTLELPPEKEAALKAQAQARGLSLEQWLIQLADQYASTSSITHLQKSDPEEWMRQFRAFAADQDRTTPPLSDEAVNRENIYPDRI